MGHSNLTLTNRFHARVSDKACDHTLVRADMERASISTQVRKHETSLLDMCMQPAASEYPIQTAKDMIAARVQADRDRREMLLAAVRRSEESLRKSAHALVELTAQGKRMVQPMR